MEEKLIEAGPVTDNDAVNNNDLAIVVAIHPTTNGENNPINGDKKNKKKRGGSFNLLKVAMLIFHKPVEKPKPPVIKLDVASKGDWKKIVGSMRPLHLQDNPSPTASPLQSHAATDDDDHQPAAEQFEDVMIAPASPSLSFESTSTGTVSQYASANNLQELDKHTESDSENEDDEDEDQVFDDKPADAMIDAKAEEFIAHFYAQMRRQQLDSYHHRGNRVKYIHLR